MFTRTRRQACQRGSSTVEYALMVAALAAALVGVIVGVGSLVRPALDPCLGLSAAASSSCSSSTDGGRGSTGTNGMREPGPEGAAPSR